MELQTDALILAGAVMPLLIAVIVQPSWKSEAKALLTIALTAACALAAVWLDGDLTKAAFMQAFVLLYGAQQAAYHVTWKPTGVASKVEQTTTPSLDKGHVHVVNWN